METVDFNLAFGHVCVCVLGCASMRVDEFARVVRTGVADVTARIGCYFIRKSQGEQSECGKFDLTLTIT